jgi:hypothetical protein
MGHGFGDLVALLRSGRLAVGLPAAVRFASQMADGLSGVYDQVVTPVVERTMEDLAERTHVNGTLKAASVRFGMAMLSFARLAGCEQRLDVSALAGAVTRLYDDLIDGSASSSLDARLSDLFSDRAFSPDNDLERLLSELIGEIRCRAQPIDAAVVALNSLHEYQSLSRRQREEAVPEAVLEKICSGKGAMANLTLCSLLKPQMDAGEQELVMALGEAFQSLDDYMDVDQDNRNGVATLAALGVTKLTDIGLRMCELRPRMVSCYGAAPARWYCGMIYFLLLKSAVDRRLPFIGRIIRRLVRRSTLVVFVTPGAEAVPAAPPEREVNP